MTARALCCLLAVGLPILAWPACAWANEAAPIQDSVTVSGPAEPEAREQTLLPGEAAPAASEIARVSGRLAVNLAAGHGNQQINSAVIAMGDTAQGVGFVGQSLVSADPGDRATRISLEGDAFADSHGLISVNIAAGIHNQMANLSILTVGNQEVLSDALLEQSRASTKPSGSTGGAEQRNDSIAISDDAFRDSSGLIQVNLIGGERNSSANTFVLSILDGGSP